MTKTAKMKRTSSDSEDVDKQEAELQKQVHDAHPTKRQKKTAANNPENAQNSDDNAPERTLDPPTNHNPSNIHYLCLFVTDKPRWKFNKVTQARILEVSFWTNQDSLPEKLPTWKPWKAFKTYVQGLQGAARNRLAQEANTELARIKAQLKKDKSPNTMEAKSRCKRVIKILTK